MQLRLDDGVGTTRRIREGSFNTITRWDYSKICELVCTQKSNRVHLIELKIPRNDVSDQLERIAIEVRKMRGSKTPET